MNSHQDTAPSETTAIAVPAIPLVVVKISGGCVTGTVSNIPGVDVLVVDYDVDSFEDDGLRSFPEKDGSHAAAVSFFEPPLMDAEYTKTLLSIAESEDAAPAATAD